MCVPWRSRLSSSARARMRPRDGVWWMARFEGRKLADHRARGGTTWRARRGAGGGCGRGALGRSRLVCPTDRTPSSGGVYAGMRKTLCWCALVRWCARLEEASAADEQVGRGGSPSLWLAIISTAVDQTTKTNTADIDDHQGFRLIEKACSTTRDELSTGTIDCGRWRPRERGGTRSSSPPDRHPPELAHHGPRRRKHRSVPPSRAHSCCE